MRAKELLAELAAGALLLAGVALAQQQDASKPAPKPAKPPAAKTEAKKPRARVVTDLSGFDLLAAGKLKKQTMVTGATRGFPEPAALAPRLGKVYDTRPVFQWSYPGKLRTFAFVLKGDDGQERFRAEVEGTSYRYPESAPALEPGKTYFWTVEATTLLGVQPSAPVGFVVVSEDGRKEIAEGLGKIPAGDAYAGGLARAQLLTDHRLWYDALAAYSEMIGKYPDKAELYEQRGTIYAQVTATQGLSDQDFAKADALERKGK
ncbi:MAG TPA: DUF928 domain-containing protein [Terriglobales bacterium]|jgi:hypothetical protein|nr:DUF928 domain-containing protein [Terriglobales bacterium]